MTVAFKRKLTDEQANLEYPKLTEAYVVTLHGLHHNREIKLKFTTCTISGAYHHQ